MELDDVFQKAHVHVFNRWKFKRGASVFIPGLGIIVGSAFVADRNLLLHEFGHYLQFKKWGFWTFFRHVAKDSLLSCWKSQKKKYVWFRHSDTWTEWSANRLSWEYFGRPSDWNTCKYPLKVNKTRKGTEFPVELSQLEAALPVA
ncbi:MAG: hypothetical protein MJZ33_04320 [Paludibacteraceae bacterium]|nr:hypothetical protein [Paludibacteraceae bacterium]